MSPDVDPLDAVADAPTAAARLARVFDRVFTTEHVHRLERWIILLAVGGFALHLGLISIARNLDVGGSPLAQLDRNYLHALYTPFSFILFFEVLQLILAIPQSTTGSIQRQFEIVSLIVIRNVFKDISLFESFQVVRERFAEFADVLTDMGGGLLMFLLVAVFSDVRRRDARWRTPLREISPPVRDFILRKKATSLLLALLFIGLAAWNLGLWVVDVARTGSGAPPTIDVRTVFYVDLFTVMIFSDVLILLLSTLHSNNAD